MQVDCAAKVHYGNVAEGHFRVLRRGWSASTRFDRLFRSTTALVPRYDIHRNGRVAGVLYRWHRF